MYFNEILFPDYTDGTKIIDFAFIAVTENIRIYYKPEDLKESKGFNFYITDFISCTTGNDDVYKSDNLKVECLFWGNVYWDGLRHLFMGDKQTDNENYLYSIDTKNLVKIFTALNTLETILCNK